jgi:hypothetical protein
MEKRDAAVTGEHTRGLWGDWTALNDVFLRNPLEQFSLFLYRRGSDHIENTAYIVDEACLLLVV